MTAGNGPYVRRARYYHHTPYSLSIARSEAMYVDLEKYKSGNAVRMGLFCSTPIKTGTISPSASVLRLTVSLAVGGSSRSLLSFQKLYCSGVIVVKRGIAETVIDSIAPVPYLVINPVMSTWLSRLSTKPTPVASS